MTQRDVTDSDGLSWACVQAYAGLGEGATADAAAADGGPVTVVCTPTGAAQTVRLDLAPDRAEALADDALLAAIAAASAEQDAARAEAQP